LPSRPLGSASQAPQYALTAQLRRRATDSRALIAALRNICFQAFEETAIAQRAFSRQLRSNPLECLLSMTYNLDNATGFRRFRFGKSS